jgi:hypothetical protein
MRAASGNVERIAIRVPPAAGSERGTTLGSGSSDPEWFYNAAQSLLGKDAGQQLHYITGYPPSSCYAYTARNADERRRPNENFLRRLFHHPGYGKPFLNAYMHGCEWWGEHERITSIGRKVIELAK